MSVSGRSSSYRHPCCLSWVAVISVLALQWACSSAQPFDCFNVSDSQPQCWTLPQSYGNVLNDGNWLWKCGRCGCDYNQYMNGDGQCFSCTIGDYNHGANSAMNRVMQPTIGRGDAASNACEALTVCAPYYYQPNVGNLDCVACTPATSASCYAGQSVPRCTPYSDTPAQCMNCSYPPIANATSMMYGSAWTLPECTSGTQPPACSYYLTPTWSMPACQVVCRPGFLDSNAAVNWQLPNCVQCATSCSAGYDLPECSEYVDSSSTECRACLLTQKDPHSHWISGAGCPWACNNGYYRVHDTCNACEARACGADEIFLGCAESAPGACLRWTTSSVCEIDPVFLAPGDNQQYLEYFVWSMSCTARSCSKAVAGTSYVVHNCTRFSDAVIRTCDAACPVGFFRTAECGDKHVAQNVQCRACSAPPILGMMRTGLCTDQLGGDAQYGTCTLGMGCDAQGVAYNCTPPRVAVAGICVCPGAMVGAADGIGCVAIACADGTFPNPATNNCSACTPLAALIDGGAPAQLTAAGVVGPTACACAPGFFMNLSTNACWRCGNLMCNDAESEQSECPGGRAVTSPTCECQLPSGAVAQVTSSTLCAVACEEGFTMVGTSNLDVQARRGSLAYPTSSSSSSGSSSRSSGDGGAVHGMEATGLERVLILGGDVIVWVAGVELFGAYYGNGSWRVAGRLDVTNMLTSVDRVGDLTDIHVVSHDAWDLVTRDNIAAHSSYQGVWIVFTYLSNHCGSAVTVSTVVCTSIERFIILTRDEFPHVIVPTRLLGPFCATDDSTLCLLYPINTFGGATFTHGDARWSSLLATASLTMGVIKRMTREFIFWSAVSSVTQGPVLVQYTCSIYAQASLPLPNDTPTEWPLMMDAAGALQCGVTSLAFSNYALYGFAPCAGILEWAVNVDVGLGVAAGNNLLPSRVITASSLKEGGVLLGLFQMLPVVRSNLLTMSSLGAIGSRGGKAYLLHVDLINGRTWRCPGVLQPAPLLSPRELALRLALDAGGTMPNAPVVHMTPGGLWAVWNGGVLRVVGGWDVCGVDMVSYSNQTCEPMQCVGLTSARKVRSLGNRGFTCVAGYRENTVDGSCTLCGVGSFCYGGISYNCGSSQTTRGLGASSYADCICRPGFYTYASGSLTGCLPCSTDAWCMGGSSYPVPCANDGVTLGFATSPLDCRCPSGTTYGLRCTACGDRSECYAPKDTTHSLAALVISGWGQKVKAGVGLETCLGSVSADWIVYDMPHLAPMYDVLVDATTAGILVGSMLGSVVNVAISQGIFAFGWVAVAQDMNVTVLPDGTRDMTSGLRDCMERSGATSLTNVSLLQAPLSAVNFIASNIPCGEHISVDAYHRCTECDAGYEPRYTQQYLVCVPCAIGKVRVKGFDSCIPCVDNNSYAPSMGMSACVCKSGFYLPLQKNTSGGTWYGATINDKDVYCMPNPGRMAVLEFFAVPLYAVLIAAGLSLFVVLGCFLLSMYLSF